MSSEPMFQSSAVDLVDLSDDQLKAWSDLSASSAVANPYFEPACQLPAAQYEVDGGRDATLVVAEHRGQLLACLPLRTIVSQRGPIRRRVAHSRSVWTSIGLGSPPLSAHSPDQAAHALLSALQRWNREGGPGVVVLDWLDDGEYGVGKSIRVACADRRIPMHVHRTWERPVVHRSSDGLSLETALSKKYRANLSRHQRRLEEALGGSVQVVDRAKDSGAVDEFLRLESSGWKGKEGGAFAVRPDAERWFRSLCANFAALDRLHLLSLEVAGRTVAMQCFLRSGSTAFLERIGHDEELSSFGPGVLLHVAGTAYLEGQGIDLIDSVASPGESPGNALLAKLYPHRRRLSTFIIATGGFIDRSAVRSIPGLIAVRKSSERLRDAVQSRRNAGTKSQS